MNQKEMDAIMGVFLLFTIICIIIGIIAALTGVCGGILLIPVLTLMFGFPMIEAIFMSLLGMTGLTISAALSYMKKRYVNYRLTAIYSILDYPGIILGGILATFLFENVLAGLCGVVMIIIGAKLFRSRNKHKPNSQKVDGQIESKPGKNEEEQNIRNPENLSDDNYGASSNRCLTSSEKTAKELRIEKYGVDDFKIVAFSSFSGGMLSALLGFGGGTLKTSSMFLAGVQPKTAAASSELSMTFSAAFAATTHFMLGSFTGVLIWPILTVIGMVIGAQIGVIVCKRINGHSIQKIFSFIVLYVGVLMILSFFDLGIL